MKPGAFGRCGLGGSTGFNLHRPHHVVTPHQEDGQERHDAEPHSVAASSCILKANFEIRFSTSQVRGWLKPNRAVSSYG
jgi:hypothetical protein